MPQSGHPTSLLLTCALLAAPHVAAMTHDLQRCTQGSELMNALRQARAEIVMGDDNRSRGYGTVRFDSKADADAAIEVSVLDANGLTDLKSSMSGFCVTGAA